MTDLTMSDRIARLEAMHREGRLIRHRWVGGDAEGRDLACVLAAIAPECAEMGSAADCPADVMPAWFARLVPSIDDGGTESAWPSMVAQFVAIARRWSVLRADDWTCLDYGARAIAVREAMTHTTDADAIAACDRVVALCDRAEGGQIVDATAWAWAWASASAESVLAASADAAKWAASADAADAAKWAASAAALAASTAASTAAWSAVEARAAVACEKSWDRMTAAIFDAIDARIAMRETEAR